MPTRRHPHAEQAVDELEHQHRSDFEGLTVQVRSVGHAIEALAAAVEKLGGALPDGLPTAVAEQLEEARWQLDRLW